MESLVKEINHRVKGTEKFWNDGVSGEAILQIRAAALCDDERLQTFLRRRPGHPPQCPQIRRPDYGQLKTSPFLHPNFGIAENHENQEFNDHFNQPKR